MTTKCPICGDDGERHERVKKLLDETAENLASVDALQKKVRRALWFNLAFCIAIAVQLGVTVYVRYFA
jgi:hypothetical protein